MNLSRIAPLALIFTCAVIPPALAQPDDHIITESCERKSLQESRIEWGKPAPNIEATSQKIPALVDTIFMQTRDFMLLGDLKDKENASAALEKALDAQHDLTNMAFQHPCLYREIADTLYNTLSTPPWFSPMAEHALMRTIASIISYDDDGPEDLRKLLDWAEDRDIIEEFTFRTVTHELSQDENWMPQERVATFRKFAKDRYEAATTGTEQKQYYLSMLGSLSQTTEENTLYMLEIAQNSQNGHALRMTAYSNLAHSMIPGADIYREDIYNAFTALLENEAVYNADGYGSTIEDEYKHQVIRALDKMAAHWPGYRGKIVEQLEKQVGIYEYAAGKIISIYDLAGWIDLADDDFRQEALSALERLAVNPHLVQEDKDHMVSLLEDIQHVARFWQDQAANIQGSYIYEGNMDALQQVAYRAAQLMNQLKPTPNYGTELKP